MILNILFITYSLTITLVLIFRIRTDQSRNKTLLEKLRETANNDQLTPQERFNSLSRVAKIEQGQIPWYERSISTIGAVLFFSMIITTAVQTIKATHLNFKTDQLLVKIGKLEKQAEEAEKIVPILASSVIDLYHKDAILNSTRISILKHRLKQLDEVSKLNNDQIMEQYNIAIILGEYEKAVEIIDRNIQVLDRTKIPDQISLAEYYFLTGAEPMSKKIIAGLKSKISDLPAQWQFKLIVLSALMDSNFEQNKKKYILEVSGILLTSSDNAEWRLDRNMKAFQVEFRSMSKKLH